MRGTTFDEAAARGLERMYRTPDVVAQRARVMAALGLREGEHVLDIGVGPGLLTFDLAATVGERGRTAGIDTSEAMLEMTRRRCAEQAQLDLRCADAVALPFEDACFDAVVSTQVFEYVGDVDRALREVARVLRPGGRVVLVDSDWDSVVWHTRDRERMRRILAAWDAHLEHPHLPTTLVRRLEGAGLSVHRCEVIPILNPALHPHCYSFGIMAAIQRFVARRQEVGEAEARAWAEELRQLGEEGSYFFSLNRYLFAATRSGAG